MWIHHRLPNVRSTIRETGLPTYREHSIETWDSIAASAFSTRQWPFCRPWPRSRAGSPSSARGRDFPAPRRTGSRSGWRCTACCAGDPTAGGGPARRWPSWPAARWTRCWTRRARCCPGCATAPARACSCTAGTARTASASPRPSRRAACATRFPVGARLPMTAGSGAKVLAAWTDPATQRTLLADAVYGERALLEVRRRGWAQSVGEREPGVASVSAPVRDTVGHGRRGGVGVRPHRPDGPRARAPAGRPTCWRRPTPCRPVYRGRLPASRRGRGT